MSNCECKTEKTAMFNGLSAFPLTPLVNGRLDESSFSWLIRRCVDANVDSICALGSTGNYAYLDREMRSRVAVRSVEESDEVPVIVGVSALSTREILGCAEDAQRAGADGLLLAPMSYQSLRDDEVFDLYETVSHSVSVPLCVYDNPTTTHFDFTDTLLAQISELPQVRSIKIPGLPLDPDAAKKRVSHLRSLLASDTTIGISGDAYAGIGLSAGCDAWYSVIGGLFPKLAMSITRASQSDRPELARQLSDRLDPLWDLYTKFGGSMRTVAAAAELLGLVEKPCLPPPLKGVDADGLRELHAVLSELNLAAS